MAAQNKLSRSLLKGLRLPLVAAPMFLVSGPSLVIACCQSGKTLKLVNKNLGLTFWVCSIRWTGILGTFPCLNARTDALLDLWLTEIQASLNPAKGHTPVFGVNLIVHKTNSRLHENLAQIVKHKVHFVTFALLKGRFTQFVYHEIGSSSHNIPWSQQGRRSRSSELRWSSIPWCHESFPRWKSYQGRSGWTHCGLCRGWRTCWTHESLCSDSKGIFLIVAGSIWLSWFLVVYNLTPQKR